MDVPTFSKQEKQTSIITRAPPEILTEIFLHYVQSGGGIDFGDPGMRHRSGPLVYLPPALILSQVCWSWKRLVETQPRLWTQVQLPLGRRSLPDPAFFSEWLGRSGSLPLDITIGAGYGSHLDDFFNALLLVSPRWRSLHFENFRILEVRKLLDQPDRDVHTPLLEDVTLDCHYFPDGCSGLSVIENAPRLGMFKVEADLDDANLPRALSSRITHLKIHDDSPESFAAHKALRFCHVLQECSLQLWDITDERAFDVIQLPHLRVLFINFFDRFGCPQFLNGLNLSSLSKLTIQHDFDFKYYFGNPVYVESALIKSALDSRISPISYLVRLYDRSNFQLSELNLFATTGANSKDLLDFLRLIPSLQILNLENCRLETDILFKALQVSKTTRDKDIIVPRLTKLRYVQNDELDRREENNRRTDDSAATILSMVTSRFDPKEYACGDSELGDVWQDSWPVSRLRGGLVISRRVLTSDGSGSAEIDELNALKELGMPLELV